MRAGSASAASRSGTAPTAVPRLLLALLVTGAGSWPAAGQTPAGAPATPTRRAPQKPPANSPTTRPAPPLPAPSQALPATPPLPVVTHPLGAVTALAFSPDGKRLAVGTFGQAVVYDTQSWQQAGMFRNVQDSVRALDYSPDDKTLAVGSGLPARTGVVTLWDTSGAGAPRTYPRQSDSIESIAFDKSGDAMLIGADDNRARFYPDIRSDFGAVLDEHNDRVEAVAFSPLPDTIFVTGAMDHIAKVWDEKSRHVVINFDQSEGGITGLAFLPNGRQFVGSSTDGRLYWWGVNYNPRKVEYTGYLFRRVPAHDGGVFALGQSADGKWLISGGADNEVIVWNDNGGKVRTFKDSPQPIYAVALDPDGGVAAGGGRDGFVRIWDVKANKLIRVLAPPALPAPPRKPLKAHPQPVRARRRVLRRHSVSRSYHRRP